MTFTTQHFIGKRTAFGVLELRDWQVQFESKWPTAEGRFGVELEKQTSDGAAAFLTVPAGSTETPCDFCEGLSGQVDICTHRGSLKCFDSRTRIHYGPLKTPFNTLPTA